VSDVIQGTVEGEEPLPLDPEVTEALAPMPAPEAPLTTRRPAGDLVRTQAAAVAVTGFAVGAVTAVALSRRRTRSKAASVRQGKTRRDISNVVASRSFLVDVHLLGSKDD
jgi:hypothetical protein